MVGGLDCLSAYLAIGHLQLIYRNGFEIEISEHPKYYRGYLPVESWVKNICRLAKNFRFDIAPTLDDEEVEVHENCVRFYASKQCPPNLSVHEAVPRALQPLAEKVSDLERRIKEAHTRAALKLERKEKRRLR